MTVEIDQREWGVYIETEDEVIADVWTNAEELLNRSGVLRFILPIQRVIDKENNCTYSTEQ